MYLEDGKCAQCGKLIDDSSKHAKHNFDLKDFSSTVAAGLRPLFCSQHCVDSIVDSNLVENNRKVVENLWRDRFKTNMRSAEDLYEHELGHCKKAEERELTDARSHILELKREGFNDGSDTIWRIKSEYRKKQDDITTKYHNLKREEERKLEQNLFETRTNFDQAKPERLKRALIDFFSEYAEAKKRVAAMEPPPPEITDHHRFEHTHILGPTGSGKTTLIQKLVMGDLAKPNPPAIVIIDPKGRMVERIAKLKYLLAGPEPALMQRVVVIDPTHKPAPPLNLFKQTGSAAAINYAINNFDYLFAQAGSELTPMMRPLFRFCARLMFSVPNADILTLMDFLESKPGDARFQPHIDQLTDIGAKRFFTKDFYAEGYRATREQVKRRFNDILSMPEILAAFTSPSPPLDLEKCLQERSIVLVHTGLTSLGPMESRILGRHIINLTIGAAFARGTNGPPAFLFIDEFQDFVDEQATAKQLRLAREYNLGIICAHQNMYCDELNDALRSAISGNTAIKYSAKVYGSDKSYMLKDLGCDEQFLDAQVQDKEKQLVRFACVVKGYPPFPVSIKYPNITPEHHMPQSLFNDIMAAKKWMLHPKAMNETIKTTLQNVRQLRQPPASDDPNEYKLHPPETTVKLKPDSPKPQSTPPKPDDSDSATEW
jgi:Type IV secretion-system coupling protein DNA-binding domain